MSINDRDFFDDGIIGDDTPEQPYIPKFEQDLRNAGGNLSALSKQKETEQEQMKEAEQKKTAAAEEPVRVQYDDADIDYVYDNDKGGYNYTDILKNTYTGNVDADNLDVKLEEMRTDQSSIISSIKNQIRQDDLMMDFEGRPHLEEMSDEYGPNKKKNDDLMLKNKLDRDEKNIIKNRLKSELEAKSKDYDKRKSAEMYRTLMAEQRAREAKKGFRSLLLTALFGLITAALIYIMNDRVPEAKGIIPSLMPLAAASAAFAVFMFVKSLFFRIMIKLFYILNALALLGPALVFYVVDAVNRESDNFIIGILLCGMAAVFSAITAFRLIANNDIKNYYKYKPDKKKVTRKK